MMHSQRIKLADLAPFKVVVAEMCMSRASIWRAARSNIPGFPPPVVVRRRVYWRKADLPALEDALFQYPGRVVFEQAREAKRRFAVAKHAKVALKRKRVRKAPDIGQQDLFAA